MDTSNSPMNVLVRDLINSPHQEDRETAERCKQVLARILENLKPILRYICAPEYFKYCDYNPVRCMLIGELRGPDFFGSPYDPKCCRLFLRDCGTFFDAYQEKDESFSLPIRSAMKADYFLERGSDAWMNVPFSELIANLKAALDRALQKRQEHLKAITIRRELLDKMLDVMQANG